MRERLLPKDSVFFNRLRRIIGKLPFQRSKSASLEPLFILILSLFIPGLGQWFNGRRMAGAMAFLLVFLLILFSHWYLFTPISLLGFFFLGILLVGIHIQTFTESTRINPTIYPISFVTFCVMVFFSIFIQLYSINWFLNGRRVQINLIMNDFSPTFQTTDTIIIQQGLSPQEVAAGDVIVVDYNLIERVFALDGDTMELRNNILFVNKKAVSSLERGPIAAANWGLKFSASIEEQSKALSMVPSSTLVVPQKNIGTLRNGLLQAIPVSNILGKVESIAMPFSRRKTF